MCRRYILMGIPFFVLFAIGTILEFSTTWVTTLLPLLFVGSVVWFLSRFVTLTLPYSHQFEQTMAIQCRIHWPKSLEQDW